jgi:hypothetical protein
MNTCGDVTAKRATGYWIGCSGGNGDDAFTTSNFFNLETRQGKGRMGQENSFDEELDFLLFFIFFTNQGCILSTRVAGDPEKCSLETWKLVHL